jgi:hypothetical protein
MIKRKMQRAYTGWNWRWRVEESIAQYEEDTGRKIETKQELLDHLFGDYNSRPSTDLDLYLFTPQDKTWKHRAHMVWAFPVTLLCAPYRYLRYGEVGWTNKTKFGKFLLTCIGEDK